jgi:hypothetical protein
MVLARGRLAIGSGMIDRIETCDLIDEGYSREAKA